jgi:hypothetical protein
LHMSRVDKRSASTIPCAKRWMRYRLSTLRMKKTEG